MGVVVVLGVILIGGLYVWRLVSLGRSIGRAGHSIGRALSTVQQRQADKAAGKPVHPINWLAVAGLAAAFALFMVGYIVAHTTNGMVGLGMMALGGGGLFVVAKIAQAKGNSPRQGGYPQQPHGWNPNQIGYGPQGPHNPHGQGGYPPQGNGQPGYVDPHRDYGQRR